MLSDDWQDCESQCRKCNHARCVKVRAVEDNEGHEDYNFKCERCGHTWWIDGIDS